MCSFPFYTLQITSFSYQLISLYLQVTHLKKFIIHEKHIMHETQTIRFNL